MRLIAIFVILATAGQLCAESAAEIFKRGEQAEKARQMARAYLLYAEAAARDPHNTRYWLKAQATRLQAILQSPPKPGAVPPPLGLTLPAPAPAEPLPTISKQELDEARQPQAPFELEGRPGRQSFQLNGNAKTLYEKVAKAYGLDVVFDGDFPAGSSMKLQIVDATCREALQQLDAATSSFLIPISSRVFLVAKDSTQKRTELEPNVAVVVPIPDPVTLQEAQELAQAVRQVMEINKFQFDGTRRLALMRDRISKVRPAQALYEQLLHARPDVSVEFDFIEVDRTASRSIGLTLSNSIPLVPVGDIANYTPSYPSGYSTLYTFGGGKSLMGLGTISASLMATMTSGTSRTLLRSELRAADGQPATFHVGDRYPVMTASYMGGTTSADAGYVTAPSFNFEDLGLVIKVTPMVHSMDEVSLEVEAEFKVLGSQTVNDIPIISTRKVQSRIRLRSGEWGILAGLLSSSDARTISGVAGLSQIPLLGPLVRSNSLNQSKTDVFLVLKPKVLGRGPSDFTSPAIWTGSEGRPLTGL